MARFIVRKLPGRAPARATWRAVIVRFLDEEAPLSGRNFREEIVLRVRALALRGVPWAIEFLADREEGRPAQRVEVESVQGPATHLTEADLDRALAALGTRRIGLSKPGFEAQGHAGSPPAQ